MNIVENKQGKFDIDTVDGAEKYLKSEGVDTIKMLNKEIVLMKSLENLNSDKDTTRLRNKVLNIPFVSGSLPDNYDIVNKAIELSKECNSRHDQIVCQNAIVKFAKWFVGNDR